MNIFFNVKLSHALHRVKQLLQVTAWKQESPLNSSCNQGQENSPCDIYYNISMCIYTPCGHDRIWLQLDKGLKPSVILCKIPNLITSGQFKKITSSPSPAGNKASVCSDKAGIELRNILSNHLLPHFSPWPSGKRRLFFSFCSNIESAFNLRSAKCRDQGLNFSFFLFFFLICVCQFYCASPDCNTRLSLCVHLPFTLLCCFYTARGEKNGFLLSPGTSCSGVQAASIFRNLGASVDLAALINTK